ncbi:MAG: D-sedoheptulose 7-phosphate isomerase [Proteobacteria bacterium]|nr:D-sedoheptulose 7-phosphate isomerase [Pseudomonadota bacterium]
MPFDAAAYYRAEFAEHLAVAKASEASLAPAFAKLLAACAQSIRGGGKLLFFGNGGSAADAQHLAAELTIRYRANRIAIAAIALTTDTSAITACGNDFGFERIFARQIEALARPGDVAIGISTSGKSANVIAGLAQARSMGLVTAAFGGRNGGAMAATADHLIAVPSDVTARIQEMHIAVGQMLCGALENELGLVG